MNLRGVFFILLVGAQAAILTCLPAQILADEPCQSIRNQLDSEQQRMRDYLLALQASYDGKDFQLSEALNHKIVQLRKEVELLKQQALACGGTLDNSLAGLSSSKTEEAQLAAKSCGELRKALFPLHRKIRALKRREKSVLSSLTPEEEVELSAASEQLKEINGALKARCAVSDSRTSLMKRLRK
ncbi:MAG: hypothetical protein FJY85_11490 [Deltaproteobacteria bacterium]|nr:hypothetical protein [Deltaproteobacteria bacterium]